MSGFSTCNGLNNHTCLCCDAINVHTEIHCDGRGPRCVFECGSCPKGANHFCRKCGAFNAHRSSDCDRSGPHCPFGCGDRDDVKLDVKLPAKPVCMAKASVAKASSKPKGSAKPKDVDGATVAGIMLVAILPDGTRYILVQKRAKSLQGFLCFPGGSVDGSEGSFAAAVREMREETGFDIVRSNAVYRKHINQPSKNAVNYIFELNCQKLPKWVNNGGHQWESQDFSQGIRATHGHNWIELSEARKITSSGVLKYVLCRYD